MEVGQLDAAICLTRYWYKWQEEHPRLKAKYVFVGDVHGDICQFLFPLIDTGTITLTGKVNTIKQKYVELDIHYPDYVCNKCDIDIYYLGDLVDGFISSRQIVIMLANIMKHCKNVHLCFGNHDSIYMASYNKKNINVMTFEKHITSLMFLVSGYPSLRLFHGDLTCPGYDFLDEYYRPMLDAYKELFKLGEVCHIVDDIVCSHTIITEQALKDLGIEPKATIEETVAEINKAYRTMDAKYMRSNKLQSNRFDKNRVFPKQIVGHLIGGVFASETGENRVNIKPVATYEDRLSHCEPTNGVYFFDVAASASQNPGFFSMPDYFYIDDKMSVSDGDRIYLAWQGKSVIFRAPHKRMLGFELISEV